MRWITLFCVLFAAALANAADAPAPLDPVPSPAQLAWYENGLTLFTHFNMDTFTGLGIGTGQEDPKTFNPTDLDCRQWASVAKECGFAGFLLTAKHHDGFCIWQTATTDHSVKNSLWKNGKGDVVRELSDACKEYGLKLGIYCSPLDLSQPDYTADPAAYSKLYRAQLTELLSNYGPVYEMWFDGNRANVDDWADVIQTVRTLQPNAVIKQGPKLKPIREDVHWVGNELACCPLTNWAVYPPPNQPFDGKRIWFPAECDTLVNGHWFWDENPPKSLAVLLNYYYTSIGRGSNLILNVAPDKRGRFSDDCVKRLREFHAALSQIFGTDFAAGKPAVASNVRGNDPTFGADKAVDGNDSTYWATDDSVTSASLEVDLGAPQTFNVIRTEEMISLGQRVEQYKVEALINNQWKTICSGTTIGYRKLDRFPAVTASKVRLTIQQSLACPAIRGFGVHFDGVSPPASFEPKIALAEIKAGTRAPK
jgi:alpha-L-fucosidase